MLSCMQCGEPVEKLKPDPDRPGATLYGCRQCDILWEERSNHIQRSNISLSNWEEERKKQVEKERKQEKYQKQIREMASGLII